MMGIAVQVALLLASARGSLLSDYVNTPDSSYSWFDTGVVSDQDTYTAYLLNVTSQTWLLPNQSSQTVWTHQLIVFVPHNISDVGSTVASLYITGNKNVGNDIKLQIDTSSEDVKVPAGLAVSTRSVWATLFQIPNQPIIFADDPLNVSRGEDSIIPFTWNIYMDEAERPQPFSGDYGPEVNVFFPMVKATFRAMDTIVSFTSHLQHLNIEKFILTGASKRGWTAWLAAAVDGVDSRSNGVPSQKRVIGLAPIVMDALNLELGMRSWWRAYGGWSFAMHDFWVQNITVRIGTPAFKALTSAVDPLAYADALTVPKLVISATGDEFFQMQDDSYWWGQLPGETHRLMVANAEHSFATGLPTLKPALDSFVGSLLDDTAQGQQQQQEEQHGEQHGPRSRPQISWVFSGAQNNTVSVTSIDKPVTVELFHAHTTPLTTHTSSSDKFNASNSRPALRRDFRLIVGLTPADPCKTIPIKGFGDGCLNPIVWAKEALNASNSAGNSTHGGPYEYTGTVQVPKFGLGWRAFFVQLTFPYPLNSGDTDTAQADTDRKHVVSTQVSIVPQTFPFDDCLEDGSGCKGVIV